MRVKHRYFLKQGESPEREVTEQEYLAAKQEAEIIWKPQIASFVTPALVGRIKTEIEE